MVREAITICVGQAGIQLGEVVWKQYCTEHHIDNNGKYNPPVRWYKRGPTKIRLGNDKTFEMCFQHTDDDIYVPRSLMIDTEPNVIDDIKTSTLSKIFDFNGLISGNEDSGNNFARGHYTIGKQLMDTFNETLRKLVEPCWNVQAFFIKHAVGGGSGSGLGSLILERIAVDYRKKPKIGFEIYPSSQISTNVIEPYNALLSTHWCLDHTDVSMLYDNEALYRICQNHLDIKHPTYTNINTLITKSISSLTSYKRYEGELGVDFNELQTNLVPFPRLHFMIPSMAPITNANGLLYINDDITSMTAQCIASSQFFVKIDDFNCAEDKYMAIDLRYHGNVRSKDANVAVNWIKENNKISFVDWCPTGVKVGLTEECVPDILDMNDNMDLGKPTKSVFMIGNNTAINRVFCERISAKYDLMYSQRAFVHWFVAEGMEEGQFSEAREDLGFLEKDYMDVLSQQDCSSDSEDTEY